VSERVRRRFIAVAIDIAAYAALFLSGAGWWALVILPYGLWNFYDGMTRNALSR
jgi:hypothetical protein